MNNHFHVFNRVSLVGLGIVVMLSIAPLAFAATLTPAQSGELIKVQQRGDSDITVRNTSLQSLITKVKAAVRLTSGQKSSLTTEIQDQIDALKALKTKLDADTDLATAKTDFQTIFTQHYIYAFYVPRVERIIAADREVDAATLLAGIATKLQGYITQAQNQGDDVTSLQASLTELQAKAADAQKQAQSVLDSLIPLTASGYPGNKGTVSGANDQLKVARTDLRTARTDVQVIIDGLKQFFTNIQ